MRLNAKEFAIRAVTAYPIYRLIPERGLRTYAALRYKGANATREAIAAYAREMKPVTTRRFSTALIAAQAVIRTGDDDLSEELLARIIDRYPDQPKPYELRSDLRSFQGRLDSALADAEFARFLLPARPSAMARVIRLHYFSGDSDADQLAITAVRRFPRSSTVLWTAAKACRGEEQYERIMASWSETNEAEALAHAVRPLATAAARSGQVGEAIRLYREAIPLVAQSREHVPAVRETQLVGRGAWRAIQDICDVLDTAQVPFFFAAGTVLGLVREGRPLDLDGDIDVGIFVRDWDRDSLEKLFRSDSRFDFDFLHPYSRKIGLRHRGGSPVDVFCFYDEEGLVWHDAVFVRWFNSPFDIQRRTIGGIEVPLPSDTDQYLTENYGDWRTPNAAFDAFTNDAPNVEVTWDEYAHLHLLRRAYKYAVRNDLREVARILNGAGEERLATEVEAARG